MKVKLISIDERQLKEYLITVSRIKELSPARQASALEKVRAGAVKKERDDAAKLLIEAGLKEVVRVANRYRCSGPTFAMLIAAGNRGLIRAVREYYPAAGESYEEYIEWQIEGAVMDAVIDAGKL